MAGVNERLAVLDGWESKLIHGWMTSGWTEPPDILNDWNALKRLEGKAREKLGDHGWIEHLNYYAGSGMGAVATPEQVAEAILAVLE